MANQEHVQILKKGVAEWNAWRSSVSTIRPDLSRADLRGANMTGANMTGADLNGAALDEANLNGANLRGANMTRAILYETVFANVDLTNVIGLETCDHHGRSIIDHRTLERSGQLPLSFLRGVLNGESSLQTDTIASVIAAWRTLESR